MVGALKVLDSDVIEPAMAIKNQSAAKLGRHGGARRGAGRARSNARLPLVVLVVESIENHA